MGTIERQDVLPEILLKFDDGAIRIGIATLHREYKYLSKIIDPYFVCV